MHTETGNHNSSVRDEQWSRMLGYRTFTEICPDCGKQFVRSCARSSHFAFLYKSVVKHECVLHQMIQHPLSAAKLKKLLFAILESLAGIAIGIISLSASVLLNTVDKLSKSVAGRNRER